MFKFFGALILITLCCGRAWALDEFETAKCGSDIPKAIVGKHSPNGRVVVIEGRHKDLGLKDLGGTEISDSLFLESWQICGNEFELLINTKTKLVRDVLPFPPHSTRSPEAIGMCQVNGKETRGDVVAVLDNSAGYSARDSLRAKTLLKATAAWAIDEMHQRFTKLAVEGLGCPLESVVTSDGGS